MTEADLSDTGEAEGDGAEQEQTPDYDDKRYSPERLLFLADGIFAISMTLLALDVRIPEEAGDTAAAYAENAGNLYGRLGVFVAAFVITSRFWVSNHRQMRVLHHVDNALIQRMILFLAGICSIPVATSVLFRFGSVPGAVTFAAIVLAVTAVLAGRVWWYMSDPERGLASVPAPDRRRVMVRTALVAVVYLLAIPVAWLIPNAGYAAFIWLLMAVVDVAARRERRNGCD